jgi:hypothetical protein
MLRFVVIIVCVIALSVSAFGRESNTYVRLNTDAENQLQDCETLINSIGGKVNHIFPPNEIICYLLSIANDEIATSSSFATPNSDSSR